MLANRNNDTQASKTEFTIGDIRTVTLPDFTAENIKKFFGNDEVKTKEELEVKVRELIENQKEESLLMQAVDQLLEESKASLTIHIPHTLTNEEVKTRMESLQKRLGGEDQMKQYFQQMGEEKENEMKTSIRTAATSSLEKFFLLRKLTELLEIKDINWEESMNVERKLYEKLKKA
jgi:FKBP-type peptidyl-prolyl cis-trans isomerase (trigger factor)